jgi:hypothetical protein
MRAYAMGFFHYERPLREVEPPEAGTDLVGDLVDGKGDGVGHRARPVRIAFLEGQLCARGKIEARQWQTGAAGVDGAGTFFFIFIFFNSLEESFVSRWVVALAAEWVVLASNNYSMQQNLQHTGIDGRRKCCNGYRGEAQVADGRRRSMARLDGGGRRVIGQGGPGGGRRWRDAVVVGWRGVGTEQFAWISSRWWWMVQGCDMGCGGEHGGDLIQREHGQGRWIMGGQQVFN